MEELKAIVAQTIKKFLLIGAGILMGCMLIGVCIISIFGYNDNESSTAANTTGTGFGTGTEVIGGGNARQIEGMDLYNADGTVNTEAIQALEDKMSTEYLDLTGPGPGHNDYSRVADWLQEGLLFQCPWWAVDRANYFLELIGSEKRVAMDDGGSVITNYENVENFTIGMEPRQNSLICWDGGEYGHIGYVEAVGSDGTIYVSACSSGETWDGIFPLTKDSGYHYSATYRLQGFIYLTDEDYSVATTETSITMLVNAYNELPEDTYGADAGDPDYLTYIEGDYEAHSEAAEQYEKLKSAAQSAGLNVSLCSAYRGYQSQYNSFQNNKYDIKQYADYYQGPLTSEHRTGLAIDFDGVYAETDWESWLAVIEQKDLFNWLYENAHKYGFILRYPKGAEKTTGIMAESWHYRYIGVEHATKFKGIAKGYEKTTDGVTYSTYTYEEYHEKTFGTGSYGHTFEIPDEYK